MGRDRTVGKAEASHPLSIRSQLQTSRFGTLALAVYFLDSSSGQIDSKKEPSPPPAPAYVSEVSFSCSSAFENRAY